MTTAIRPDTRMTGGRGAPLGQIRCCVLGQSIDRIS